VQGDNWLSLALAALMKVPKEKEAWLGAEALRRITEAPLNDQRRFLLGECVQANLSLVRPGNKFSRIWWPRIKEALRAHSLQALGLEV
jgi:hypothetical protein